MNALLRLGDDALVLAQRLGEWCGHAPALEEDIALTNIALDLIGQTQSYLSLAGTLDPDAPKTDDELAFLRSDREFKNLLLVEQSNGHFGDTIARQFLFDKYALLRAEHVAQQTFDMDAAAIAAKAVKEIRYHADHSSKWIIRLGDGPSRYREKPERRRTTAKTSKHRCVSRASCRTGTRLFLASTRLPHNLLGCIRWLGPYPWAVSSTVWKYV